MTNQDLCEMIRAGIEGRHLEFKAPMRWDSDLTKAKITKAAISMTNIRDGGRIIIGVEERPKGVFNNIGVTQEVASTYNLDDISGFINGYADPYVGVHLDQTTCDGKTYVVIAVDEFEEMPVICKRDYPKAGLQRGKIYWRSRGKNECSEVMSTVEMREIVDLAVDKSTRKLLERLKRIGLETLESTVSDERKFLDQLGDLK
nr:ATP-binding protein [Candidatus Njordarchaeota archaeon]